MKVEIVEIASTTKSTVSMLFVNGLHTAFVIEDGYNEIKIPGETRIPAGVYNLKARYHGKFHSDYKRKFGHDFAIEIEGVEGFSDVLIHIGNTIRDTRGCPLINLGFKIDKATRTYVGIESTTAYKDFYNELSLELKAGNKVALFVVRNEIFG